MDSLKTWPERIYLQCGDDSSEPGDTPDYAECHGITWEAEKINACDVTYVRADLVPVVKECLTADPLQELADQAQALDMGYGKPEFDNWFDEYWETHGQFVRAGGGDYEKSFAYRAAEAAFAAAMLLKCDKP